MRNHRMLLGALLATALAPGLSAQFAGTGNTTVSVVIGPEAALQVTTGTTALTTTGSIFNDFTGTTSYQYKVRTSKVGGGGNIQLQVTSDFSPNGGPSVANPPSPGDALTYTCTASSPATACSGTQTAQTAGQTAVASFGANARSTKAGNNGSIDWKLTNDPLYETGSFNATVTFTISAT